ncbi:MAG: hypothetical protein JWP01_3939 [Myxococcales bacterium]|nr:hypothetical protein [Myxococcales bacterium]
MGSWFSVTPLVHLTERNVYGGGLSYGMRLALPAFGAIVGSQLDEPASSRDPYASAGILIGMIAASAIDIGLIAQRIERHVRSATTWVPQIAVRHDSVGLGVAGAF